MLLGDVKIYSWFSGSGFEAVTPSKAAMLKLQHLEWIAEDPLLGALH